MQSNRKINIYIPAFVFLFSFLIYFITLSPTIGLEDSAELVSAGAVLGIAHPSGYPLYTILGKIFTFLPIGDIAFRINLMSAFFASLTNVMVYLIIHLILNKIKQKRGQQTSNKYILIIALALSLIFAFTETFWSQSVIAEVYTLNSFLFALTFYLILKWSSIKEDSNNQRKTLFLFSFIYGLSLANHLMMLLLAPVYLIYIFICKIKLIKEYKTLFICVFLFFLGLAVYLYLPIRSMANPPLDWGNPENFQNFKAHVLRTTYGDFSVFENLKEKILFFGGFINKLKNEFTATLLFFGSCGLIYLAKRKERWKFLFLSFGLFLSNSALIIFLRKSGYNLVSERIYQVYFLLSYIIFTTWIALFFNFLIRLLNNKILKIIISIILLITPLFFIWLNFNKNNQAENYLAYDYNYNLLQGLEKNAIIIFQTMGTARDSKTFPILYFQIVKKLRPDITIIEDGEIIARDEKIKFPDYYKFKINDLTSDIPRRLITLQLGLEWAKKTGRPLYSDFIIYPQKAKEDYIKKFPKKRILDNVNFDEKVYFRSNGIVYKVYTDAIKAKGDSFKNNFKIRNIDDEKLLLDMFGGDLISQLSYAQAAYALENGKFQKSQKHFIKAIKYDDEVYNEDFYGYIQHRSQIREMY